MNNPFGVNVPLTEKQGDWFARAETGNCPRVRFEVKMQVIFLKFFSSSSVFARFYYSLIIFCKQLGSGLSPQSCLCFQCFLDSKSFDKVPYVSKEYSNFRIQNQYLQSVILKFPKNAFETIEIWCIVRPFDSCSTFIAKENSIFL